MASVFYQLRDKPVSERVEVYKALVQYFQKELDLTPRDIRNNSLSCVSCNATLINCECGNRHTRGLTVCSITNKKIKG